MAAVAMAQIEAVPMQVAGEPSTTSVAANEVANSIATVASMDPTADVYRIAVSAIRHRVACRWIQCADVSKCARAMARAWFDSVIKTTGEQDDVP